jgi:hypothetical protein
MDEANFVNERENSRMLTEALLLQATVAGILSKEARNGLKDIRSTLNVRVKPKTGLFVDPPW